MCYWDINRLFNRYMFGVFLWLFLIPNVILSEPMVASNDDLVSLAIKEMAQEIIDTLQIEQDSQVSININEEVSPRTQFIFKHFCMPFKHRSIELYLSPDSMDDGIEIEVLQNTMTIHYGTIFRKKLWGKKWISRDIQTSLTILAVQKYSRKVLYLNESKYEYRDEFLVQFLRSVQYPRGIFDEFHPVLKNNFRKYLEPFLMIGFVIGIGYLFYFIRS